MKNLLFQPTRVDDDLKCVTVSCDKSFKIWQVVHVSTVHRKFFFVEFPRVFTRTFEYRDRTDLEMHESWHVPRLTMRRTVIYD